MEGEREIIASWIQPEKNIKFDFYMKREENSETTAAKNHLLHFHPF